MSVTVQTIGVRELKAHLSKCLKRVRRGERLTVTDRGRPIATLEPVSAARDRRWMDRLLSDGHVTWGGGKPAGLAKRVKLRGMPTSRMVLEDRR